MKPTIRGINCKSYVLKAGVRQVININHSLDRANAKTNN